MNKREIKKFLKDSISEMEKVENYWEDDAYQSVYLGSVMSLDPCGRYHHILSPNRATRKCELFWERLENVAEDLGGWIESGKGDPTDIFFCMPLESKSE